MYIFFSQLLVHKASDLESFLATCVGKFEVHQFGQKLLPKRHFFLNWLVSILLLIIFKY